MKNLFLLLALSFLSVVHARVVTDEQGWMNMNAFYSFRPEWQLYLEVQPRFNDHRHYLGTTLYRTAVGRSLGQGLSGWVGYGFIEYSHPRDFYEDRPFLQLMHAAAPGSFKLTQRLRSEGRYLQDRAHPSIRWRYLTRVQWRTPMGLPIALVGWDEWFWNSNSLRTSEAAVSPAPQEGFDQNRAFVGVGWLFGEGEKNICEVGYMNHYVHGTAQDQRNNVLAVQATVRF